MMIRDATAQDIPAIAGLHAASLDKNWSQDSFQHFITSENHNIMVAEKDGALIGFLITQTVADETEIISIATHPDHRRDGIASSLMAHIKSPCFLEVRKDNNAAITFYAKHNFTQVGIRKDYYSTPNGKINALILRS